MPESMDSLTRSTPFDLTFPAATQAGVDQDEEFCEVTVGGRRRRIRFHDYGEIYSIPGLYEHLFYDRLRCTSPEVVRSLLEQELSKAGVPASDLAVIDIGAGNGMMGEQLQRMGASALVGVDIIEEAAAAAKRDRPDVYREYRVLDLTELTDADRAALEGHRFNGLTTVAALGFGDMPPLALAEAFNMLSLGGWVAFTIKDDFLHARHETGFSRLVRHMSEQGPLEIADTRRYQHRLSAAGEPLFYQALVGRKRSDVPLDWATEAE